MPTDVHQHLWPPDFIELLRARTTPPQLDGWTLHLDGEPPYEVDPADHDIAARARLAAADGLDLALVSLSSPLGIEYLPPAEAAPLLAAFHDGALALPAPFGVWASPCLSTQPDPEASTRTPSAAARACNCPPQPCSTRPGGPGAPPCSTSSPATASPSSSTPARPRPPTTPPPWWPALVPYVHQMHASWFAFRAFGRARHPGLRVCFAALAGLAPLHGERLATRGGGRAGQVDFDAFYETSSYGTRAVDAVVRAVGIDVVVGGSDRPYARPGHPRPRRGRRRPRPAHRQPRPPAGHEDPHHDDRTPR